MARLDPKLKELKELKARLTKDASAAARVRLPQVDTDIEERTEALAKLVSHIVACMRS